jgi:hypothetical protein
LNPDDKIYYDRALYLYRSVEDQMTNDEGIILMVANNNDGKMLLFGNLRDEIAIVKALELIVQKFKSDIELKKINAQN